MPVALASIGDCNLYETGDPGRNIMPDGRKTQRRQIDVKALIVDDSGALIGECVMADISEGGARITNFGSAILPDKFVVILSKTGAVRRRCEIVWRADLDVGTRFAVKK